MIDQPPDIVTASRIAEWASCPGAWSLRAIGTQSVNQPAIDAGIVHQGREKGRK